MVYAKDEYKDRDLILNKQPWLYENDNENLFLQFMPTPPGRFCIRLQEYAKGGWQVFL